MLDRWNSFQGFTAPLWHCTAQISPGCLPWGWGRAVTGLLSSVLRLVTSLVLSTEDSLGKLSLGGRLEVPVKWLCIAKWQAASKVNCCIPALSKVPCWDWSPLAHMGWILAAYPAAVPLRNLSAVSEASCCSSLSGNCCLFLFFYGLVCCLSPHCFILQLPDDIQCRHPSI